MLKPEINCMYAHRSPAPFHATCVLFTTYSSLTADLSSRGRCHKASYDHSPAPLHLSHVFNVWLPGAMRDAMGRPRTPHNSRVIG